MTRQRVKVGLVNWSDSSIIELSPFEKAIVEQLKAHPALTHVWIEPHFTRDVVTIAGMFYSEKHDQKFVCATEMDTKAFEQGKAEKAKYVVNVLLESANEGLREGPPTI